MIPPPVIQQKGNSKLALALSLIALSMFICTCGGLGLMLSWPTPKVVKSPPPQVETHAKPEPAAPVTLQVGEVGVIAVPGESGGTFVADSRSAYDKMIDAVTAKDYEGFKIQQAAGNIAFIKNRTRVRVLGGEGFAWQIARIRVLDGPLYPQEVWINTKFITRP